MCARPLLRPSGQVRPLPHGLDELPTRCVARHPKGQPAPTFSHLQELGESVFRCQCRNLLNPAGRFAHSKMAAQSIYSSLEALSTPEATKLAWTRLGKTCEAEGAVLTKVRGGSYPRHATNGRLLTTGVHVWEYEFTSAAKANGNRTMYVGVAQEGLDVEKGGHSRSGKAWYLRTDNGTLYGSGVAEPSDQTPVERCFVVGDRIGNKGTRRRRGRAADGRPESHPLKVYLETTRAACPAAPRRVSSSRRRASSGFRRRRRRSGRRAASPCPGPARPCP